MVDNAMN